MAVSKARAARAAMSAGVGSPEAGVDLVKTYGDIAVRKP